MSTLDTLFRTDAKGKILEADRPVRKLLQKIMRV